MSRDPRGLIGISSTHHPMPQGAVSNQGQLYPSSQNPTNQFTGDIGQAGGQLHACRGKLSPRAAQPPPWESLPGRMKSSATCGMSTRPHKLIPPP